MTYQFMKTEKVEFDVDSVEREFEMKMEVLDVLSAKRDLLFGQLLCEYKPFFIAIVESSEKYGGKLETYYKKRFAQDPSTVQRYMRVWAFWNEFALQNGAMSLEVLAQYANSTLDAVRRLYEVRADAVFIEGGEIHLNPVLITDGRGTCLKEFMREDIDRLYKTLLEKQEYTIVSLHEKGVLVHGGNCYSPLGSDISDTTQNCCWSAAGEGMEPILAIMDIEAAQSDGSTASATDTTVGYPQTFWGKEWKQSLTQVTCAEGNVTTDNAAGKYCYRAVNCRVKVVLENTEEAPRIIVTPIDAKANGSVVIWQSGEYTGTETAYMVYTYDALLGISQPTYFERAH